MVPKKPPRYTESTETEPSCYIRYGIHKSQHFNDAVTVELLRNQRLEACPLNGLIRRILD